MSRLAILPPRGQVHHADDRVVEWRSAARALGWEAFAETIPWDGGVDVVADGVPTAGGPLVVARARLAECADAGRAADAFVLDAGTTEILGLVAAQGLAGATDLMALHAWARDPAASLPVRLIGWPAAARRLGAPKVPPSDGTTAIDLPGPLPEAVARYLAAYLEAR